MCFPPLFLPCLSVCLFQSSKQPGTDWVFPLRRIDGGADTVVKRERGRVVQFSCEKQTAKSSSKVLGICIYNPSGC